MTLTKAQFIDLFTVADVKFSPQWQQQRSKSAAAVTYYGDRAPMSLTADVTSIPMAHSDANALMSLINSMNGGIGDFLCYDPKMPYPANDPTGSIFGAATPIVGTIADRFHAAFTGFPFNYPILAGTWLQIIFNSTSYYLGQFVGAPGTVVKTSSGAGAVTSAQLSPALPASIVGGEAVTLIKPAGKFNLVPNSAYPQNVNALHSTISWSAEQTYAP